VPTPFPAEFRADVIAVARKGQAPLRPIAKDFGISEACLHRWLKIADRQDRGDRPARHRPALTTWPRKLSPAQWCSPVAGFVIVSVMDVKRPPRDPSSQPSAESWYDKLTGPDSLNYLSLSLNCGVKI
jgi:transposase-like protein